MQLARHFLSTEPKLAKEVSLIPNYSVESHAKDHQQYMDVSRNRCRRAKALLGVCVIAFKLFNCLFGWSVEEFFLIIVTTFGL
jgi:hypothetical protein